MEVRRRSFFHSFVTGNNEKKNDAKMMSFKINWSFFCFAMAWVRYERGLAVTTPFAREDSPLEGCKFPKSCLPLQRLSEIRSVDGQLNTTLEMKAVCKRLIDDRLDCLPTRALVLGESQQGIPAGTASPLLRVFSGDILRIELRNLLDDTPPGGRNGRKAFSNDGPGGTGGQFPARWLHPDHADNPYYPSPFGKGAALDVPCCANLTNLHPHGLHVSPNEDNVLEVRIRPGETRTMTYHLHELHSPGTHWYHPHSHGSVTLQASGGAAGVIVVEDDPKELMACCPELHAMQDEVILVSGFQMTAKTPPKPWDGIGCPPGSPFQGSAANFGTVSWQSGDNLYAGAFNATGEGIFPCPEGASGCQSDFPALARIFGAERISRKSVCHDGILENMLVNGQIQPVLEQNPGEFRRWRLINAAPSSVLYLQFPLSCQLWLIALDGIYLMSEKAHSLDQRTVHIEPGARADVALRCDSPGLLPILAQEGPKPTVKSINYFVGVIMMLKISGTKLAPVMRSPGRLPNLARIAPVTYLSDVSKMQPLADFRLNLQSIKLNVVDPDANDGHLRQKLAWEFTKGKRPSATAFEINRSLFQNSTDFLHESHLNVMEEWEVCSNSYHPFHAHTSPFLLTEYPFNFSQWPMPVWRDTVMTIPDQCFKIRLPFRDYVGHLVLHCHILTHEDEGMMRTVKISNASSVAVQLANS